MKPRPMKLLLGQTAFFTFFLMTLVACSEDAPLATLAKVEAEQPWDHMALSRVQSPPLGLPPVRIPENNPVTVAKIALGRKLFFDRRLSVNNTMSCAICHIPEQGFTNNELATPLGVEGRSLRRNAPTILNAAFGAGLFHDGRAASLEEQATAPLLAHDEMANPSADSLIRRMTTLADYDGLFEQAFGGSPTLERIGMAIASWERTMLAADSPFDHWRYGDQTDALTQQQQRGFELFVGKGQCSKCHLVESDHAIFVDNKFHDTGIGYQHDVIERRETSPVQVELAPDVVVPLERDVVAEVGQERPDDRGRFEITRDPKDTWRFKTPTLRNVAVTAPYMHDGSLPSLESVLRFYNRGGVPHTGLDPLIKPLYLDDSEIAALVAFLKSLTSSDLDTLQADARSVAVGN